MNLPLVPFICLAFGWIFTIIFFILWFKNKTHHEEKYNKEAILEIRKELRTVHEELKTKMGDLRSNIYDLLVSIDKIFAKIGQ
jgi:hypothetical protein